MGTRCLDFSGHPVGGDGEEDPNAMSIRYTNHSTAPDHDATERFFARREHKAWTLDNQPLMLELRAFADSVNRPTKPHLACRKADWVDVAEFRALILKRARELVEERGIEAEDWMLERTAAYLANLHRRGGKLDHSPATQLWRITKRWATTMTTSIENQKPWEAEGVSRATWYRRRRETTTPTLGGRSTPSKHEDQVSVSTVSTVSTEPVSKPVSPQASVPNGTGPVVSPQVSVSRETGKVVQFPIIEPWKCVECGEIERGTREERRLCKELCDGCRLDPQSRYNCGRLDGHEARETSNA